MKPQLISLTPSDIEGFDRIVTAILECDDGLNDLQVGERYHLIGDILLSNARAHQLDEDIVNLLSFARCIACEVLSVPMQVKHFRGKCWDFEPPMTKHEGSNRASSEIRSIEKQKIAMVMTLVHHLHRDQKYTVAAKVLSDYETKHSLWTEDDYIDRE